MKRIRVVKHLPKIEGGAVVLTSDPKTIILACFDYRLKFIRPNQKADPDAINIILEELLNSWDATFDYADLWIHKPTVISTMRKKSP